MRDECGDMSEDIVSQIRYEQARAQLIAYHERWKDEAYEPFCVEHEYYLPVVNPSTGRFSRIWRQAGKYDGGVIDGSRRFLLEHKTTSMPIDQDADFWRTWAINSQASKYMLSAWQEGNKLDGTLLDVIKKATIKPKKLAEVIRRQIASLQEYCGQKVQDDIVQNVIAGQMEECPRLYGMRFLADMRANPDKYFARRIVPRLDSELLEFAEELWQTCKEINNTRTTNAHYRNSGACMTYGRACDYLGICSGYDTPESDKWSKTRDVHGELATLNDGLNVITNSRLRCYHTCRRKHYYRYELGLRRVDEKSEALIYGHLLHVGLEYWWKSLMPQGEDNGDSNETEQQTASPGVSIESPVWGAATPV